MNEAMLREQAARARREFLRWILLLTLNLSRPAHATLRMLLGVAQGEYPDATELEVRRELDYLEGRELLRVFIDPLGQVSADLTRHGIDVVEYTVPVDPGIARPPKG
ncbi:MAG: hypothetical protein LBH10_04220 [Burkholderiaceae bacterium]|jgi:hypothetical protein|nr:hypothetical protein [Burkholderiaceae bacterium]